MADLADFWESKFFGYEEDALLGVAVRLAVGCEAAADGRDVVRALVELGADDHDGGWDVSREVRAGCREGRRRTRKKDASGGGVRRQLNVHYHVADPPLNRNRICNVEDHLH